VIQNFKIDQARTFMSLLLAGVRLDFSPG